MDVYSSTSWMSHNVYRSPFLCVYITDHFQSFVTAMIENKYPYIYLSVHLLVIGLILTISAEVFLLLGYITE